MRNAPDDTPFALDLRRAREGDRQALDRLFALLGHQLLGQAGREMGTRMRGKTRASDLAQSAYVTILREFDSFRGSTELAFRAWAAQILKNAVRREHRWLTARKRRAPSRTSQLDALAMQLLGRQSSAASEVISRERVELLGQAIESLTEEQRLAVEQCLLRGRPAAELAAASGRSVAAVQMLLSRARAALLIAMDRLERT